MSNNLKEVQRLQSLGFSLEEAVEVEEAQRRVNDSDDLCMGCREIGPACYCGNLLDIEIACMRDPETREAYERIRRRFRQLSS